MKSKVRNCGNCRWAKWGCYTQHKVPRPHGVGDCAWPLPIPDKLPISISGWQWAIMMEARNRIWPDMGVDCPTWDGPRLGKER